MNLGVLVVPLAVVALLFNEVSTLPVSSFFPFGPNVGDQSLPPADTASGVAILKEPILFYGQYRQHTYINIDGTLNLLDNPSSGSRATVLVFSADVDTRELGQVFYRTSVDPELLQKARAYIRIGNFSDGSDHEDVNITSLFIATWFYVGYFDQHDDAENTFQCVIANDARTGASYVALLYANHTIEWTTGDSDNGSNGIGGSPAQVGFISDNSTTFFFDGSGTNQVINISRTTNIGIPGLWLFRTDETVVKSPRVDECTVGFDNCDRNAACIDTSDGFLCVCNNGFSGNGVYCLHDNYTESFMSISGNGSAEQPEQASCVAAGFDTCCNMSAEDCRVGLSPDTCQCDQTCFSMGDCCSDIFTANCFPGATIGLTQENYVISENQSSVKLTVSAHFSVNLTNAEVNVVLYTSDDTAKDMQDYTGVIEVLTFSSDGQKEVSVPILMDRAVENTETFLVHLASTIDAIHLEPFQTATVHITSSNMASIGFDGTFFPVMENAKSIDVCITVNGSVEFPFNVTVSTQNSQEGFIQPVFLAALVGGSVQFQCGPVTVSTQITLLRDGGLPVNDPRITFLDEGGVRKFTFMNINLNDIDTRFTCLIGGQLTPQESVLVLYEQPVIFPFLLEDVFVCLPLMAGVEADLLINGIPVYPLTDPQVDIVDDEPGISILLPENVADIMTVFRVNNASVGTTFQCIIANKTTEIYIPLFPELPMVNETESESGSGSDLEGSCIMAGHQKCCNVQDCIGSQPYCFCDQICYSFRDCCQDIQQICLPDSGIGSGSGFGSNSSASGSGFGVGMAAFIQPVFLTALVGGSVQFQCGPLTVSTQITLLRDGGTPVNDPRITFLDEGGVREFTFINVNLNDANTRFSCLIEDHLTSQESILSVYNQPLIFPFLLEDVFVCLPVMTGIEASLLINGISVDPLTDPQVDIIDDDPEFQLLLPSGIAEIITAFRVNNATAGTTFQCIIANQATVIYVPEFPLTNVSESDGSDLQGSCVAAGHQDCCNTGSGTCKGSPPSCYCDQICYTFGDCCQDIQLTCLPDLTNGSGFETDSGSESGSTEGSDPNQAQAGMDYEALNTQLTFNPGDSRLCTTINIADDSIVELDETFPVMLSLFSVPASVVADSTTPATIVILDNDKAIVELEHAVYAVNENASSLSICAVLSADIEDFIVTAHLTSENINALAGTDYKVINTTLTFTPGSLVQCSSVIITDDSIAELDETFLVTVSDLSTLSSMVPSSVTLGTAISATVTIIDNDLGEILFELDTYTVDEGSLAAEFCVNRSGALDSILAINIFTSDGTAMDGIDYIGLTDEEVLFGENQQQVCRSITLLLDPEEGGETFFVSLSTSNDRYNVTRDSTTIVIVDRRVRVSLTQSRYVVSEAGGKVVICLDFVGNQLGGMVIVNLATRDDSAMSPTDYFFSGTGEIVFFKIARDFIICERITINDNNVINVPKRFFVEITTTDHSVSFIRSTAEVYITDDESDPSIGLLSSSFDVTEGDSGSSRVRMCMLANGNINSEFTASASTMDGTAKADSDYSSVTRTFTFGPFRALLRCVSLTVLGDIFIEEDESFSLQLTSSVPVSPDTATINIINDDGVIPEAPGDLRLVNDTPAVSLIDPATAAITVDVEFTDNVVSATCSLAVNGITRASLNCTGGGSFIFTGLPAFQKQPFFFHVVGTDSTGVNVINHSRPVRLGFNGDCAVNILNVGERFTIDHRELRILQWAEVGPISGTECALIPSPNSFLPCSSPYQIPGLDPGQYRIILRPFGVNCIRKIRHHIIFTVL